MNGGAMGIAENKPDYHEELIAMIGEGDVVAVHLRITGTQPG